MTFEERVKIQVYIEDPRNSSLISLAKSLDRNRVTIYNEIVSRRYSLGSRQQRFLKEKPLKCQLLTRYPFCCNCCPHRNKCAKEIFIYDAYNAHESYEKTKHECNKGPAVTTNELKEIDNAVSPRVFVGQSLYHIKTSNPSIPVCEQTIRRYIRNNYLQCGIIDLPRTVQRRANDTITTKRARVPVGLLANRMYADYVALKERNKSLNVIQIDTVIGKRNDKKVILTIFEPKSKLQFGILVNRGYESINNVILDLYNRLGERNLILFDTIVTDNGSEFMGLPQIEVDEFGVYRFRTFYCDPYSSWQKGGCERNHEFFRYIKKKGISLDTLTQYDLNVIFSNINSLRRKSLNGSTPYEVFKQMYGVEVLTIIGIDYVDPLKIILKK